MSKLKSTDDLSGYEIVFHGVTRESMDVDEFIKLLDKRIAKAIAKNCSPKPSPRKPKEPKARVEAREEVLSE